MDGNHSAPGLCVLPTEHGRHDVTACHQHRPVSRQYASWMARTKTGAVLGVPRRNVHQKNRFHLIFIDLIDVDLY